MKKLLLLSTLFIFSFCKLSYSSEIKAELMVCHIPAVLTNDSIPSKTTTGKVIRDVGEVGKKFFKKVKELFAVKHKIPDNYVFVNPIRVYDKDSLAFIISESKISPRLKLVYPRITPSKGYFSFQLGDYEKFKYFDELTIDNIEYIKLISEDGEECVVDKFEFIEKESARRHFSFLLDHSGSMGKKRASILQNALFNAIKKNISNDKKASYSVYKFSVDSRLIAQGSSISSIGSGLMPANGLSGFGGGTAVKDVLFKSITDLSKNRDKDFKAIILFTDGDSNSDLQTIPMSNVIKMATENNINIISVAFGSYLNVDYLKDIAMYSGGDLFHIYSPNEFENLFNNIFKDVALSYDLEFVPCFFGENITLEMKLTDGDYSFTGQTIFRTPIEKGFSIDISVEFDINSSKINKNDYQKFNSLYSLMSYKPDLKIIIEGHSDKLGNESKNIKLSKARAESVKMHLINRGISPKRISTIGYGSSKPAFGYEPNSSINPKNRRINIVIDQN
ncbi:OmpA family protein [Flavobacteriaceae bacterium]|nr:OmpA family protein [Flavobacteriaceae bacterium]